MNWYEYPSKEGAQPSAYESEHTKDIIKKLGSCLESFSYLTFKRKNTEFSTLVNRLMQPIPDSVSAVLVQQLSANDKKLLAAYKEHPRSRMNSSLARSVMVQCLNKTMGGGCICKSELLDAYAPFLPKKQNFFSRTKKPGQNTTLIKVALSELGYEKDFKVYANRLPPSLRQENGGEFANTEWLYDLHWYTEADEIRDLPGLIERWTRDAKDDPISEQVWKPLSLANPRLLKECQESESNYKRAQVIVGQALGKFIRSKEQSIYNIVKGIKGFGLRTETRDLNHDKPKGRALVYLNRLLLQDAYAELSRNHEYQPIRLPLVVECQWDPSRTEDGGIPYGGFKYDFQKLLVANAELRLMIYILRQKDQLSDLEDYFDKSIQSCAHLAEKAIFLLIAFDQQIDGFHYAEVLKS